MPEIATLLLVTSAMVAAPVGLLVWSCRVAPPVKARGVTILDLMQAIASYSDEMQEMWLRAARRMRVTVQDIHQLTEAYRSRT